MNELLANISSEDIKKLSLLINTINGSGRLTKNITLQNFVDEYSDFAKHNLSSKSCEGIKSSFTHLLKFFSSARELSLITPLEVERFVRQVTTKAPKGIRVYVRTLKAAFTKAVDWNYVTENPFAKIKLPKQQQNAPAYLTTEEFNKVLEKIEIKVVKEISTICFYTGLRLGEATALRWSNIDLKNKLIIVGDSNFNTKTRKQRIVPMHKIVEEVFIVRMNEKQVDKSEFVFSYKKNKSFTTDYISRRFKRACRAAGMDEAIHFHSTRHSAATNMAQSGAPIVAVKEILGHSNIQTTMIYAHTDIERKRAAVNLIQ